MAQNRGSDAAHTPSRPQGKNAAKNLAAVRQGRSNRTVLILGAATLVIVIAVVVTGIVLGNKEEAPVADGYGASQSTATLNPATGVITLASGSPAITLDIYEDALCPFCGAFEQKFGQQIAQAVDESKVGVRYHLMNFLDQASASKDYSTRAAAAMMCVAQESGSTAGVFGKYHQLLFSASVQPKEGADTDHTDDQLAGYATEAGATAAAASCITAGSNLPLARTSYDQAAATLTSVLGKVSSPVVLNNNVPVSTVDDAWLSNLLAAS